MYRGGPSKGAALAPAARAAIRPQIIRKSLVITHFQRNYTATIRPSVVPYRGSVSDLNAEYSTPANILRWQMASAFAVARGSVARDAD
jgi:hypothetical protein